MVILSACGINFTALLFMFLQQMRTRLCKQTIVMLILYIICLNFSIALGSQNDSGSTSIELAFGVGSLPYSKDFPGESWHEVENFHNSTVSNEQDEDYKQFYERMREITGIYLMPFVTIFGVIGNLYCAIIYQVKSKHISTNFYLVALSVSDIVKVSFVLFI